MGLPAELPMGPPAHLPMGMLRTWRMGKLARTLRASQMGKPQPSYLVTHRHIATTTLVCMPMYLDMPTSALALAGSCSISPPAVYDKYTSLIITVLCPIGLLYTWHHLTGTNVTLQGWQGQGI